MNLLRVCTTVTGIALATLAVLPLAACGAAAGNGSDGSDPNGTDPTSGGNSITNAGEAAPSGFGASPTTESTPTAPQTCASTKAEAKVLPVYLSFMFDRSGSMGTGAGSKWDSCGSALKTFLKDPRSAGVHATMGFFPVTADPSQGAPSCNAASYKVAASTLRPLPEAAGAGSHTATIDASTPAGGNTPTRPALQGAIETAKDLRTGPAAASGGKVAVVLVTDGDPTVCEDGGGAVTDRPAHIVKIANDAKAVNKDIETFVIGVGTIANLDTIAKGGDPAGARKAFVVSAGGGAATNDQFLKALEAIRGSTLSCEYAIPQPPAGQSLELGAVNVVLTSNGKADTLAYSKDCTAGGWRYDNPNGPSKIQLCKTTCDALKGNAQANISIELGCATKGTDGSIPR